MLAAAPEHQSALEAIEQLFASGTKQVEIAGVLEPLYQTAAEWEKLHKVYEAQLTHLTLPGERLSMYYQKSPSWSRRSSSTFLAMAVYTRAVKEAPLDEKASEEVERLAGLVDGGWEKLANAYADVLGLHTDQDVQRIVGGRLARTFEEELGDITKAEETYRYVLGVAAARRGRPFQPRSHLHLARAVGRLAQVLEQRVKASAEPDKLVELYARLGETYEDKLGQVDDAVARRPANIRRARQEPRRLDRRARPGILRAEAGVAGPPDTVYERELENATGDVQEAEIRAKIAHLASERLGNPARAIERWKRVLDLRGEDPEALSALANLYDKAGQWASSATCSNATSTSRSTDDVRFEALNRRARVFSSSSAVTRSARRLQPRARFDYANVTALRSIATPSGVSGRTPTSWWRPCTRSSTAPAR